MSCGKSFHVELGHHECARALVDSHHRSALWRWALVRAVRKRSKDPDTVIVEWLRYGAPVGVVAPIHSGGLLPLISKSPELVPDSLFELAACDCNNLASI